MSTFTDFQNGLSDVNQYLSAQHHKRLDLQGSVADVGRFVVQAEYSTSLKEIICSLLAGRGLKLPNIQLCIFLNLQELLGIPQLQSALSSALNQLADGFQKFLNHTRISDVLGRINNILAEVTSIANMINFCSSPIDPVAIPNILEQGMQSFLGAGQDIINRIGQLIPSEIGGCLTPGGFNCAAFSGGLLGRICDNFPDIVSGNATQDFIDAIQADVNSIVNDIETLIDQETNISGTYDQGGSDFIESPRPINDTVGVLHNGPDEGIQGNTQIASQLKALYDNLGSYQVVGNDGTVYNNIFETFVEPDLLRLLRRQNDPQPRIANRQPVFNYCGEITGYTEAVTQEPEQESGGSTPGDIDQPGFNAGGLPTNPVITDSDIGESGETVNNITNIRNVTGNTQFADSEQAMLALDVSQGTLVYRTDTNQTFVKNDGMSGTISDFNIIGGSATGLFVSELDSTTGNGILVRNGDTPLYRNIQGTPNQIGVDNADGVSGNPIIRLVDNPIIPGSGALRVPTGVTSDRINVNGNIRYNTQTNRFEGYMNNAWQSFAIGSSSVTDGANLGGGGIELFKQNNIGILEFRTINAANSINITAANDVITIGENLTVGNSGAGAALGSRTNNQITLKSIVAGSGVVISENTNEVVIETDVPALNNTATTTDNSVVPVSFSGITPSSGKARYVEVQATAKRTNGTGVTSIKVEGIIDNSSGTVTLVGTAGNRTVYNSTSSTANYDLILSTPSNSTFQISVRGETGHNVNWAVRITYQEV